MKRTTRMRTMCSRLIEASSNRVILSNQCLGPSKETSS